MAKVLTYPSFGGYIPDVVSAYLEQNPGADMNINVGLIQLIESFRDNPLADELTLTKNPDKLFYYKTTEGSDGITRTLFAGYSSPNEVRIEGHVCTVCINEFNEAEVKTIIMEYDGSETLKRLPKYIPVPGAPGLYREEKYEEDE